MFSGVFSGAVVYGPAKEETQEYYWEEYDVGCFQSVCHFIFDMLGNIQY